MANMEDSEASSKRTQFANIPTVSMIRREVARPGVEKDWKEIQSNTFRNWSNYMIAEPGKNEVRVNDLLMDFSTGVNLIELINHLAKPRGIKSYVKIPKTEFQKLENLNKALNFIQKEEGIKLVGIGAEDMKDGREKPIMGLIWTLIKHYKIRGGKEGDKGGSATDSLKKWVNYFIYPEKVNNFEKDWNNGIAICSLVEGLCPDTIDTSELNGEEDIENCELGIAKASEVLNVPTLISGEDMSNPGVDQLSMMTYLSGFISAFEKILLDWVNLKIPEKDTQNLSTDWNSGDRLTALLNAFIPEYWDYFDANDEENFQRLLNKIEGQFPTKSDLNAKQMMEPQVDNLKIGCYLFRLKQKLDQLEKQQMRDTERLERERLAKEKLKREQLALEKEKERLENERLKQERENEALANERLEQEKEKERLALEREKQRIEGERLVQESVERAYREEERMRYERMKLNLLNWVNEMLWPKMKIANFETDWLSADAITVLLNSMRPNVLPESEVKGNNAEKWNIALKSAENNFGLKADFNGIEASQGLGERKCIEFISNFVNPFNNEMLQWVNTKLSTRQQANNFGEDWKDGKRLAALLEAIAPGFVPVWFDSNDKQQGQELLARVHREFLKLCPFSYEDILSGNFEPDIMAAYINRFRTITLPYNTEELLLWLNCMVCPFQVNNLTTSMLHGVALKYLLNAMAKNEDKLVDRDSAYALCKEVVETAEKLGIYAGNFESQELAEDKVDEFRMRQYLSKFRDVFMHNNEDIVQEAGRGLEAALRKRDIKLSGNAVSQDEENRELLDATKEKFVFTFPADNATIRSLDKDIHITSTFLFKLSSAEKQVPITPAVIPAVSQEDIVESPYPATMDPEAVPLTPTETVAPILKQSNISRQYPAEEFKKRPKVVRYFAIVCLTLGSIIVALMLIGAFIGLIFQASV